MAMSQSLIQFGHEIESGRPNETSMKPQFERVTFPKGCSLRVYNRRVEQIPFEWHHHPEYELTLTLNSRGWRFVGDHVAQYTGPDLVLIPPDMPHTWASTAVLDPEKPHTAVVTWFSGPWLLRLVELCPEYAPIRKLLKQAAGGLVFDAASIEQLEEGPNALLTENAVLRLQAVLALLLELAHAPSSPLSVSTGHTRSSNEGEPAQLTRVLNHLHKRYNEPIRIEDLCAVGSLSPRSLHRLFTRHVGESVSNYLCKLRIARACMRLVESDASVSMIADEVGLPNLANFNRHFRRLRRMTPTDYRASVQLHGTPTPDYGHCDGESLSDRPKSLERIRSVRRPKVLSLENQHSVEQVPGPCT